MPSKQQTKQDASLPVTAPKVSFPLGTPLRVAAFVASFTIYITLTQGEHGVPPNKHYEIPFVRGYAVLFPLPYLVNTATRLHSVTRDDLYYNYNLCYN